MSHGAILTICIFGWWISAFIPLWWMSDVGWRDITPKELMILVGLSSLGPVLSLIVIGVVLSDLDWWNQPIFGGSKKDDE